MITCPKCNKQLADGTKFCDGCGAKIVPTVFCPNCGQKTSSEFEFCQNCGSPIGASQNADKAKSAPAKKPEAKFNKKILGIGVAVVAIILVVALLLPMLFSGGQPSYMLYIKDRELFYSDAGKINPVQVTENLFDYTILENSQILEERYEVSRYATLSKDGDKLFFPDKIDDNGNVTLYYREINKKNSEPVKIDSEVGYGYQLAESGEYLVYMKDGNLYEHDLEERNKIASDVDDFYMTKDGKKVVYVTKDGEGENVTYDLYTKTSGKDAEKIESEIDEYGLEWVSEDGKTVYFLKDDTLYKKVEKKDKEKIASDVTSVLSTYESGEMYYVKSTEEAETLYDYIINDNDYDEEIMSNFKEMTLPSKKTLCYYTGSEEKIVSESYSAWEDGATKAPVMIFAAYGEVEIEKKNLSDLFDSEEGTYGFYEDIQKNLEESAEYYLASEETATVIEAEEVAKFRINAEGTQIYYLAEVSEEKKHGDLYSIAVKGGKPEKAESYDTDVSSEVGFGFSGDRFYYYKDYNSEKSIGELYVDKVKIDSDVYPYQTTVSDKHDKIVYMVDYDKDDQEGTLKIASFKGKPEKIQDDVYNYTILPDGEILFLYDYSFKSYRGELYICEKKKPELVSEDVTVIIPVYAYED